MIVERLWPSISVKRKGVILGFLNGRRKPKSRILTRRCGVSKLATGPLSAVEPRSRISIRLVTIDHSGGLFIPETRAGICKTLVIVALAHGLISHFAADRLCHLHQSPCFRSLHAKASNVDSNVDLSMIVLLGLRVGMCEAVDFKVSPALLAISYALPNDAIRNESDS